MPTCPAVCSTIRWEWPFKLREAQSFLKEVLADGPLPQTEIEAAAQQAGIRPKTLRNARYELGVTSTKISKQWVWALPEA